MYIFTHDCAVALSSYLGFIMRKYCFVALIALIMSAVSCNKNEIFDIKETVRPELKGNFRGLVTMTVKDKDDPEKIVYRLKDFECNNVEYKSPSDQVTLLIPAMNRIPVGNVEFKNTTRNYVTDIRIFRTGEKDVVDVYSSIDGYYDTNESVSFILREGNYDMVYTIKNGDTGEVIGTFMIEGFEVDRDDIRKISTLDGKRI